MGTTKPINILDIQCYEEALVSYAKEAIEMAYAPYSNFRVGAALLTKDGEVYTGCNIENASYSATNCAERTAFFKAVSEGKREFHGIAIITDKEDYISPCGICRQVMAEFCKGDFEVLMCKSDGTYKKRTLTDLLPEMFDQCALQNESF